MLKNNKKGFSLVELIIVIAIMVALVAVMAPAFVKYVKSSREATMTNAVESVVEFAKSEYATGNLSGAGVITVTPASDMITVDLGTGLTYNETAAGASFSTGCGISGGSASKNIYTITVATDGKGNTTFVTATSGTVA